MSSEEQAEFSPELLRPPAIPPGTTLVQGLDQCVEHFGKLRRSMLGDERSKDMAESLLYLESVYGCLKWYVHPQTFSLEMEQQDWDHIYSQIQPLMENRVETERAQLLLAPVIQYFNGLLSMQKALQRVQGVTSETREAQQQLFTITEVAQYLSVSKDTVRRLVSTGDLAHTRILNSMRILRSELDAYLQRQTTREWKRVDNRGKPMKKS